MIRRCLLWLILILQITIFAVLAAEIAWPDSVESSIYDTVQWLRADPSSTVDDIWTRLGRWLISWWFFVALASHLAAWVSTIALAAFEQCASLLERAIWCVAILFVWFPTVPVYCIVKLLQSNHSFERGPLRGSA